MGKLWRAAQPPNQRLASSECGAGGCGARGAVLDPLSLAVSFDGFATVPPSAPRAGPSVVAQTWLLREGWKRHGLIRLDEVPAS
jgi:hypothetical protein